MIMRQAVVIMMMMMLGRDNDNEAGGGNNDGIVVAVMMMMGLSGHGTENFDDGLGGRWLCDGGHRKLVLKFKKKNCINQSCLSPLAKPHFAGMPVKAGDLSPK